MDVVACAGDDAPGFVELAHAIVRGAIAMSAPRAVHVTKIDSWFGPKWLSFSSKLVGAVGVQHRRALRIPPFVPNRVVSERYVARDGASRLAPTDAPFRLHIAQPSSDNEHRLVAALCPDTALIWWSGTTSVNRRGALMAYLPSPEGHTGWYAELIQRDTWGVGRTIDTTAAELAQFATAGAGARHT